MPFSKKFFELKCEIIDKPTSNQETLNEAWGCFMQGHINETELDNLLNYMQEKESLILPVELKSPKQREASH